jgi:hypothetical protein
MAMTETTPTEQLAVLGTQTATAVIATTIQHEPIVSVSSFHLSAGMRDKNRAINPNQVNDRRDSSESLRLIRTVFN